MENNRITWKVSDVVLVKTHYHGWSETKIVRVTPTQAVIKNGLAEIKLRQGERDGQTAIGSSGYANTFYYADTPATRAQMETDTNREYLKSLKIAGIPTNSYGQIVLPDEVIAKVIAVHKAAMAEINGILNNAETK